MGFRTRLSALLAVLLLAFTFLGGTGVGAQDEEADELQIEDLPGIQHSVNRTYSIDYSAMIENMSTPGAELEMPSGLITLSAIVLEFDGSDNAGSAFDSVTAEIAADDELATGGVEEIDLDLGNQSSSYAGTEDFNGTESDVVITVVQSDQYVYLVYAGGTELDLQETVSEFTSTMIDNDGSGEGEFNEDGTSTGGLWDKFPDADDDLVSGLMVFDTVIYPETESDDEG